MDPQSSAKEQVLFDQCWGHVIGNGVTLREALEAVAAQGCWGCSKMGSACCGVTPEMEPIHPESFQVGV